MHITLILTFPRPVTLQVMDYILSDLMGYIEESGDVTFFDQSLIIDGYTATTTHEETEATLAMFKREMLIQLYSVQVTHQYQEEEEEEE